VKELEAKGCVVNSTENENEISSVMSGAAEAFSARLSSVSRISDVQVSISFLSAVVTVLVSDLLSGFTPSYSSLSPSSVTLLVSPV
jgi:hypothetical protein